MFTRPSIRIYLLGARSLACVLFVYMLLRANLIGFTHDESASFLGLIHVPVYDLFFDKNNWGTANNHLLNTLCMQLGMYLFGPQEWALRWGSLLGGLLFLRYAWRWSALYRSPNTSEFLAVFALLTLQPFLVEFFSLARGYGLCIGLEMAALFYFFRWIKDQGSWDLLRASLALSIGILANFTLLDVLAVWLFAVLLAYYLRNLAAFSLIKALRLLVIPMIPVVITAALIFLPMRWIRANGEFEWGPVSFWETWRVLLEHYFFNPFRPAMIGKVLIAVLGTVGFLAMMRLMIKWFRNAGVQHYAALFYAVVLTVGTMFVTILQHILLGANYLIGRTALLFYPLLFVLLALFLMEWSKKTGKKTGLWAFSIFALVNFCASANLFFSREWRYDANVKAAIEELGRFDTRYKKINYGVGWKNAPATQFYQQFFQPTRQVQYFEPVLYDHGHNDVQWFMEHDFDYIYVLKEFESQISSKYFLIHSYSQGGLYRRKP